MKEQLRIRGLPTETTFHLSKVVVLALLASLYTLAFIISPYWMLAGSPAWRVIVLILTVGIGAIWSHLSADEIRLRFDARDLISFIVLLLGIGALNFRELTSVIPWRGDESTHIIRTLALVTAIPLRGVAYLCVLFGILLYAAWKRSTCAIVIGLVLVTSTILYFAQSDPFQGETPTWILHYPLINYWLFSLIPMLAGRLVSPYHEILFRIVPVLSMSALAWTLQRELAAPQFIGKLLWAFAVATVPLVFYYTSILYIEPLAAFLMTVVCLQIRNLLREDPSSIKRNPAWYALILIGFIKETTVIFLLCFLLSRLALRLLQRRDGSSDLQQTRPGLRFLAGELAVTVSVFLPQLFYLLLRGCLTNNRSLVPYFSSLSDITVYRAIGQGFLEQFGPFLILFLAGCVLMAFRKDFAPLSFCLMILLAIPAFHTVDHNGAYAGYSRFNLFVMPVVLAGGLVFLKQFVYESRGIGAMAASVIIALNLLASPVNLDGSKVPFWGNYRLDISEHYYPYGEALRWLKENQGDGRVLFAGLDYPYYFDFYFNQLDWHPRRKVDQFLLSQNRTGEFTLYFDDLHWRPQRMLDPLLVAGPQSEGAVLSEALDEAGQGNFTVVLFHVLGTDIPALPPGSQYSQEKVFQNQAHILVVYTANR